jgi:hypothetical protein
MKVTFYHVNISRTLQLPILGYLGSKYGIHELVSHSHYLKHKSQV